MMLPGGSDVLYRSVLAAGHRHYARVEVWSGDGVLLDTLIPQDRVGVDGGLFYSSGSVSATLDSRVSRQLMLSVPMDMYPTDVSDLLAPFGNEIRAFAGVRLGDGSLKYVWQVFRGKIRDVTQSSDGTCTVTCADRANDVVDAGFVAPMNSVPQNTVFNEWQRLIADAVPDANFGVSDVFDKLVEPLTWEFDRGSALDEMARGVGALWYPLANGDFVLRRFPWATAGSPVITLSDGPLGEVLSWTARRSRDSIFNVVTVTGERLNGDAPVFAVASDEVAGSPTNIFGNFGVRSRLERLQTPSTQGGAQTTADALLRTYIAPTEEWTLGVIPDASLELGDVVTLDVSNRAVIQVVVNFALPLDLSGSMTVSTRSLVLGGV
jgi:uncharacterized protein DUF5047